MMRFSRLWISRILISLGLLVAAALIGIDRLAARMTRQTSADDRPAPTPTSADALSTGG